VCTKGQHTRQARYRLHGRPATTRGTATASAAAEARELLREDIDRLQKELLIISSICRLPVIVALLNSDPERAWRVSESVLLQHEKYRNDSCFPNIRDLLSTFSRIS
jgi:hypothetical protein